MKRFVILLLAVVISLSAYCQTSLQDGERCFDSSDYSCAETKYKEAIKLATGNDKQIVEIKLTRAKWCADHMRLANDAFANKNYKEAKENYESVLDSNPNDFYAKKQLEKCKNALTPPATTLSISEGNLSFSASGGKQSITVTTNAGSYSVNSFPLWCTVQKYNGYFDITCTENPSGATRTGYFTVKAGDKTVTIDVSQYGKATNNIQQEITLSVTKETLSFSSLGGKSEQITVYSNASTYSISLIPSWCSVQTYSGYFIVSCDANSTAQSRSDWFKVTAGGKELKVYVNQVGITNVVTQNSNTSMEQYSYYRKRKKCFNCPKTKDTWGITAGYIQKSLDYTNGIQLGLRVEPLFKYGFGLNTGLNVEGYFRTDILSVIRGEDEFKKYALNIPLHLEYRLNFSKWINIFAYGGAGLNIVTDSSFDNYSTLFTGEYGGGLRINHVQFNIGRISYLDKTYNNSSDKLILSVSYMF